MKTSCVVVLAFVAALVASCSASRTDQALGPLPELPRAPSPRLDEVFAISSHNAYWVDRGARNDLFASGVGERLLDQLLYDRARSIEIDIHKDAARPHQLRVYHSVPGNSLCDDFRDCLAEVRAFHQALPGHDPLVLVLELKELSAPNFDAAHTIADLDGILRDELGGLLYQPSDLAATCPGSTELGDCVRRVRWPALESLRGRVLTAVLGNWDDLGFAQASKDWADYAADAMQRAAFPIASTWKLVAADYTTPIVTQAELDRGWAQSAFAQIEALDDPYVARSTGGGVIVRIDGANSLDDQLARVTRRLQLLQTDTPWVRVDDGGPTIAVNPFSGAPPPEPGARLLLAPAPGLVFAALDQGDHSASWTTTVASGADARRVGCLRAAAALDAPTVDAITVCRTKAPASARGTADAERVTIEVTVCQAGQCATSAYPDTGAGTPGDLVALDIGSDGCARVRSASAVGTDQAPRWVALGTAYCPARPLTQRGLARPAADTDSGPVLFVATAHDGVAVSGAELTVYVDGAAAASPLVSDASVR